ncbi:unnamed protein product [Protopolystoma xenopodis]|uniref:Uncharacterized protein n=1 Tax=Protopolystoma xenopodis TaxID=117903 RepID=A0A448WYW0_9PLAT|nr:unnamed protein product [Protopolystoma xenopodis]
MWLLPRLGRTRQERPKEHVQKGPKVCTDVQQTSPSARSAPAMTTCQRFSRRTESALNAQTHRSRWFQMHTRILEMQFCGHLRPGQMGWPRGLATQILNFDPAQVLLRCPLTT